MNIIEGPGPSSVATRVMGTGLEENLGLAAWSEREGAESVALEGSVREDGLLPELSEEAFGAFSEVPRLIVEAGLLCGLSAGAAEDAAMFELGPEIEAGLLLGVTDCSAERPGAEVVG